MSRKTKVVAKKRSLDGWSIAVAAAAVVFVGAIAATVLTSGGEGSDTTAAEGAQAASAATPLTQTGEVSSMGLPVIETPGYASGVAGFGGVAVQGANWAMGRVPLDVAVLPFWTLTNTGTDTVRLGEPRAEVRAGCCPGPFSLGARTLQPGTSTVLTFELAMHEGMDGWHDMGVFVPVETDADRGWLELGVSGDFGD